MTHPLVSYHTLYEINTPYLSHTATLIITNTPDDTALEVGLKLQGQLRLPVFSLPTLASDHYQRTKNEVEGGGVVVSYVKKSLSELRRGMSVQTVPLRGQVRKPFIHPIKPSLTHPHHLLIHTLITL